MSEELTARRLIEGGEVVYLPVDKISPSPHQPRRMFQKESIEELAGSIREYGVMQPVTVRMINGSFYELVAGERRLRASKLAGLPDIPAVVVQISDKESAMMALIENLQRENLNFFDEAEGLKSLTDDYGFTQEEVARKIGKNQSTVANKIRILRIPREIQRIILESDLTERHARALLSIPKGDTNLMYAVLKKVIAAGLTVKETENLIANLLSARGETKEKPEGIERQKVKRYFRDIKILKNTIEQAVMVMNSSGVETEYDIEERDDGCFISILVSYT
ncbi:MAG: ParB/RepB/Spo0J family partition protein [Clostridiales bacterium]|jgi:ParB family chromosome partitioning protein|nr:ParB/RepB/Spo0J family partition protein [Clostridiales bacterium]